MKKTRMTTKALSMLLTVIMLFTTISVGIIVPDAKVTANAAVEETVGSIEELNAAIDAANNAGMDTVTKITLSADIVYSNSSGVSVAAFEAISGGNVILDLAGHKIDITVTKSSALGSDDTSVQAPAENAGEKHLDSDVLTTAMINVSSGSKLQIYNSSATESKIRVYTDIEDTKDDGDSTHHQTSSSVVYSEGTLILGESDGSKGNFEIYSHASSRNTAGWTALGYTAKGASASSFAVTVKGAGAIFKMYGGKIQATGVSRVRRDDAAYLRVYALNIDGCNSAEIYGGQINVPSSPVDSHSGLRQTREKASKSANAIVAAIRCNTPNLYIFKTESYVETYTGENTSKDESLTTACIYATSSDNAPVIFGGKFSYWAGRDSGNSTANNNANIVVGSYRKATKDNLLSTDLFTTTGKSPGTDSSSSDSMVNYTVIPTSDGLAENALNVFSYNTFREYVRQYTSVTRDGYYGNTLATNSGATAMPTVGRYLRDGYVHEGWKGTTTLGGTFEDAYSNPSVAGITSSGGVLYVAPTWKETEYKITFSNNPAIVTNSLTKYDNCLTSYKISSIDVLGEPTNPAYNFTGWKVVKYTPASTDTRNDAWSTDYTYAAGTSVNGKTGNLELQAQWEPKEFTATFELNGGKESGSGTYTIPYTIADGFAFPSVVEPPVHFDMPLSFTVKDAAGSWNDLSAVYAGGTASPVNSYGNVTFSTQYTPVVYTITYVDENNNYITEQEYDFVNPITLEVRSKDGYVFKHWEVVSTEGNNWAKNGEYSGTIKAGELYGDVTLRRVLKPVEYTIEIVIDEDAGETYSGDLQLDYFYDYTRLVPEVPEKSGYNFLGWKVIECTEQNHMNKWIVGETFPTTIDPSYYNKPITLPMNRVGSIKIAPVWSEPVTYKITLEGAGGTVYNNTITYNITENITLPDATRDGYVLTGWQVVDADGNWFKGDTYNMGTYSGKYGSVTLQAKWTERTYTVTYDANGGTVSSTTQNYDVLSVKLAEPTKAGYTFKGWVVVGASGNWKVNDTFAAGVVLTDMYGNVTLKATWEAKEYSIIFPSDSENGVKKYTVSSAPTGIEPYAQDGFEFEYWYVSRVIGESNWKYGDVLDENAFEGKYGNIEVEAQIKPIEYTYTVVGLDGAVIKTGKYTIRDTITLPAFSANGYEFLYWTVQSVADGAWRSGEYAVGDIIAGSGFGNVVFAPVTEKISYTIKYNTDGGSAIADAVYTIEDSVRLANTSKAGYTFNGWQVTSAAGNWTSGAVVSNNLGKGFYGNVELTAMWSKRSYDITWNTANGLDPVVTPVLYGDTPEAPADINVTKNPDAQYTYTFSHWAPAIVPVTGNATYIAQYSKTVNSYTVTWVVDGVTTTQTYEYGKMPVYNNGANPEKAPDGSVYYRFAGWDKTVAAVTGDETYTAEFVEVKNPATVIWVIDENISYETKWEGGIFPYYVGTPVKPDADGYTYAFTGWDQEIVVTVPGKTYTYNAKFTESMQIYTATFDLNGGKFADVNANTAVYYTLNGINLKPAEKDGYSFIGWNLKDNSGTWDKENNPYPSTAYQNMWGNVEFVAEYEIIEYNITISDVTGTSEGTYKITDNTAILTFAGEGFADSREGYELTGWTVAMGTGSWITSDTFGLDKTVAGAYGNVTIAPVWTAKTYTVTWVSGDISQVTEYRFGEIIGVQTPVYKAGYAAEWDKEIPAAMPAEDLTFTAEYSAIRYYLRFDTNGGDAIENIYYTIESTGKLPVPEKEGATFEGWKVSAGNGSWIKSDVCDVDFVLTGSYGNATLTAQWKYDLYTVTWVAGDVTRTTYWYYGAVPSYSGTPTKASDEKYSYKFTGWDKPIVAVTGDVEYVAQFEQTERLFIVRWDIDGFIADAYTLTVEYGTVPVYTGPVPVREATDKYEFRFIGWTPEISAVTGDVTYSAQFEAIAKLQGLRIDTTILLLNINDTAYVSAIIFPSTAGNDDVDWISQNTDVATIDSTGKITAVSAGSAVIRVQSKDEVFKAYCVVQVAPVITEYILVSAAGVSTTRRPGDAIQLYATIMPDNATNQNIIWTSSNPAVATVDQTGFVVYGSEEGTAIITAISDGYASGSIKVVTTSDEGLIEDSVQTYVVMFLQSSSSYIIAGETYDNINVIVREGDTLEFLLTQPHFATVNGAQFDRDVDGVYRLKNIDRNYTVYAIDRDDIGMEQPDESEDNKPKETFFDKLKAFFRSIVEFFRNLFN